MPRRAESSVPAVVGETNLFCDSCCMMRPHRLMLIPESKMLIKRGMRLIIST